MRLTRAAFALSLAAFMGAATAGTVDVRDVGHDPAIQGGVDVAGGAVALKPRAVLPKLPTPLLEITPQHTGRLIVKFADGAKVRLDAKAVVRSAANRDLGAAQEILAAFNVKVTPAFKRSNAELEALEARARDYSKREQPDLAGMYYVDGPPADLLATAKGLNELAEIEWVQFEQKMDVYWGGEPPDPGCGVPGGGTCFDPNSMTPFCEEENCCFLVCDIYEFCCAEGVGVWDENCVALANLYCDTMEGANRCASPLNGSCFEMHDTGGCNNQTCCEIVCAIDQSCCDDTWSEICVELAKENCQDLQPEDMDTPDFKPQQGYLTAEPYPPPPPGNPSEFTGYGGEGYDLGTTREPFTDLNDNGEYDAGEPFKDLNANGFWDRPGGGEPFVDSNGNRWWDPGETFIDVNMNTLWDKPSGFRGFAEELYRSYGIDAAGTGNNTDGKGVTVAVIEWSCWNEHEEWYNAETGENRLTVEENQTLIQIESATNPSHATACLSIIGAKANGRGVEGMVPRCKLRFYPLTSVEEGPRFTAAWLSAISDLGPGDVISASYGPPTNLNNDMQMNTIIRFATDSGITTCIAAGNNCTELSDGVNNSLPDSGGIVVGACSPGNPWYRLAFSNYHEDSDYTESNVIHLRSWGAAVTAAGYGDLFVTDPGDGSGSDMNRSYTTGFGGTSAATPMVASTVATLQAITRQYYGITYSPETVRDLLQTELPGRSVNRNLVPIYSSGFPENAPGCAPDVDPEQGPSLYGWYSFLTGGFSSSVAAGFLNQQPNPVGFDESPLVEDLVIVTGLHRFGNVFSVKGDGDGLTFDVGAVFTSRSDDPGTFGANGNFAPRPGENVNNAPQTIPEIGQLVNWGTGYITDLVVVGRAEEGTLTQASDMQVMVNTEDPGVPRLVLVEAYNYAIGRWQFLTIEYVDGPAGIEALGLNGRNFVRIPDRQVLVRIWSLGIADGVAVGGGRALRGPRTDEFDFISIEFGEGFGEEDP